MADPDTPIIPPTSSNAPDTVKQDAQPGDFVGTCEELSQAWHVQIITLLPEVFPGVLGASLTGRALRDGLWKLDVTDLREFGIGKHRNVDDTPAGGGAGMVLRADVMGAAINAAQAHSAPGSPLIYLSPRGRRFDQVMAQELSQTPGVTLICGRFEGLDERVIRHYNAIEVSLGDFVMTGGEIAAQAIIDAALRLRPGILGNAASSVEESHSSGLLEHPQYTRPAQWQGSQIPEVLMSGNHGEIAKWRQQQAEEITQRRRPDLWEKYKK